MNRKKNHWTVEKIREIVDFAETHSLKETCSKFRIKHVPQFYYLKNRLERLEKQEPQTAPTKRGRKPGPKSVAKRRGRPPKATPATPPSSKLLGLLEKVVSSLEELSAELQRLKASGKRSVRQKSK